MTDDSKKKDASSCWPSDSSAGRQQSVCTTAPATEVRNTEHCMVCGSSLTYLEQAQDVTCTYCGKVEHGHIQCPNDHYICDSCHNRDAITIIENIARTTTSKDPFEIAELMMSYPDLPMLGCQHAYIAGGAFLAAIKNEGSRGIMNNELAEVFTRTEKQAHGGYCGLSGVCGIAPAIGACFSVITGAKCGTREEQRITMEAVTRVTRAITNLTGPSCCKAYVWSSLDFAAEYLRESLGVVLPTHAKVACSYTSKHPHGCRERDCPYFAGEAVNVKKTIVPSGIVQVQNREQGDGTMEQLLKRALELGAEHAKIIATDTVVVEEWVRWKCKYGCAFYDKDGCHPPVAPDTESTRKVMKEYSKAVLLRGSKGKLLTEVAVRLEGEAYHKGYYKAFALTALASGGGSGAT